MQTLFQEILSFLWIFIKQKDGDSSSIDEETVLFFKETKPLPHSPIKKHSLPISYQQKAQQLSQKSSSIPKAPVSQRKTAQQIHQVQTTEIAVEPVKKPPETPSQEHLLMHKHNTLLPKEFIFLPIDTFETRKKIHALQNKLNLHDGCLYETPEKQVSTWAFFSFPLPIQEEKFFNSVIQAVSKKLQKKISRFSCQDTMFAENLTLSALDSEKLFFFIEQHNESTLKRLLETIPSFSKTLPKGINPFIPFGSIHGNPLHLFFLRPTTSTSTEIKSRLWLALKQLAFGMKTP